MTDKERKEIVKLRLENAHNAVKEAKLMKENGFWNAAINRMYYACYYAVSALLVEKGLQANSHAGVRQMLGLYFIKEQKISIALGNYYSNLFAKRHSGDYDDYIRFDQNTVEELFPDLYLFIETVECVIENKNL